MTRIGSIAAAPFLGSAFVALYLGDGRVPTVPDAAVLVSAAESVLMLANFRVPENDGGSAITGYRFYLDGDEIAEPDGVTNVSGGSGATAYNRQAEWASIVAAGKTLTMRVRNAIGDGPLSNGIVVAAA